MSALLGTFTCCVWWFLLGVLVGWLLNRWLCRCCCKVKSNASSEETPTSTPPVAKVAETPVAKAAPAAKAAKQDVIAIDLAAAKAAGFSIKNADDLTVIEGIGPKINTLFKNAGLKTFAQVAKASVPEMRKILDEGGSSFRIANPETWAKQAGLAAANKWVELKKLQDELSGGRRK